MNCVKCGKEVPNESKFCLECGSPVSESAKPNPTIVFPPPQPTPISASAPVQKKKTHGCLIAIFAVIGFFVLLAIIGAIVGGGFSSNSTSSTGSDAVNTIAEAIKDVSSAGLEIIDHSVVQEDYVRYVVGTVKNNSNKKFNYVQVEINLYDDSGSQVGSTMANVNNLEPGGSWKFKAVIMEDNATKYKIKDVTGF